MGNSSRRLGAVAALLATALLATCASATRVPLGHPSFRVGKATSKDKALTDRPLIGIVSEIGDPAPGKSSYIAASYVKYVESAGARAVPILADMPPAEVERRFRAVNGILVPGGSQPLWRGHPFYDTTELLLNLTVRHNEEVERREAEAKGFARGLARGLGFDSSSAPASYFPLQGTCLGLETLAIVVTGNRSILGTFDSEDLPSALFPTDVARRSRFFSSLPPKVVRDLFETPRAMQNHVNGVALSSVEQNPSLRSFFDVLTLSADRGGRLYASTLESRRWGGAVFATQWHPEKNAFEWTHQLRIPHDRRAVAVTQATANYLVDLARRNAHAPASPEEESALLIYNYDTEFTGIYERQGEEVNFDETYVFPPWEEFEKQERERRETRKREDEARRSTMREGEDAVMTH